jgi:hypothetical protein
VVDDGAAVVFARLAVFFLRGDALGLGDATGVDGAFASFSTALSIDDDASPPPPSCLRFNRLI